MDDHAHRVHSHLFPIHTHTLLIFGNEYGIDTENPFIIKKKRCQSVKYDIRTSSLFLQPQI